MEQKNIPKVGEYNLKIKEIIDEVPEVKTFRVEVPNDVKIDFKSGQFFMVRFDDDPKLQRAYSVASSPTDNGFIDITMNLVGKFTHKLFESKIGDSLIFKGPYGMFYFTDEMKNNLVLIAGGLGVTPLRSIIRQCCQKKLPNKLKLIYSVRTPADIVYREELEKIKDDNHNYDQVFTITRPRPEHNWQGHTGRVDEKLLKDNIEDVEGSLYFLCGPLEFVKSVISMLEGLGVKKEQIKTDIWGA